ncbi:hypothetical protein NDU88_005114 [Pleurodeles waltl]|uniref:Uncharacterized protein n=1 Tax=Pleurodeles waltl TaxID=8319 RepID=A0AAV7MBW6_PLEWA|nr:hypothetical protein NDU88_005114 [Pleurodeles waltl]
MIQNRATLQCYPPPEALSGHASRPTNGEPRCDRDVYGSRKTRGEEDCQLAKWRRERMSENEPVERA